MADSNHIKACRACGTSKPLSEFAKKERGLLGVRAECNICRAAARRTRYATDDAYRASVRDGQKQRCVTPAEGYLKRCPSCGDTKPFDAFYRSKYSKDNCSSYCKKCQNLRSTSYARENKSSILLMGYSLRARYGVTPQDYDDLMEKQGHRCAICGTTECKTGRNFAVDHCHKTGKVRGLLCANCNVGLGGLKDDIEMLKKALNYLYQHAEVPQPEGMR